MYCKEKQILFIRDFSVKMASIDLKTAALILDRAFINPKRPTGDRGLLIEKILRGTHKTYRYILVNALLAKATDESINILSLQKGDGNDGKYDARSLCHKVLVPFETLKLPGCLGGSNEPFLNKPARFVMLSTNNAVRAGKDRQTLEDVIRALSTIDNSKVAYLCLRQALYVMCDISKEYVAKFSVGDALIDISEFSQIVLDYIYKITEHCLDGETCPLVVAQLEQMYLGKDYKVRPHKVNESGASSKEIGDIDVFSNNGELVYSIEVKDKNFSEQDVSHAITKFRMAGLTNSIFIYGRNASFEEDKVFQLLKSIGREGHYCCLISILHYAKLRIADLKTLTIRDFVSGLLQFAKVINANDDTIEIIKDIAGKIFTDGNSK